MPRRREQPLEHRLLLTATFCLLAGGAVMVYSASSARTLLEGQGDGTMYLVKYVGYGAVGLIAMYTISRLRRIVPTPIESASRGTSEARPPNRSALDRRVPAASFARR